MTENQENSTSNVEEPKLLHIKQSEFAKGYLNDFVQKLVTFKNQVKYLEQEQVRTQGKHHLWQEIDKQLRERKTQLSDLKNAVKAAKDTLDEILEQEKQGKYLA